MHQPRDPAEAIASLAGTGIAGLDDILGGGLTRERLYLIEGTPGAGKTTLALQFLLEGVGAGETGLYITLSETERELRAAAATHGWSLDDMHLVELVAEDGLSADAEQTLLHPSDLELGETVRGVIERVQALKPSRVVLDSLSELRLLAQTPLRYRRQILALKQFFSRTGCTVLVLDDRTDDASDLQLHSIAHGVITLEHATIDFGAERRRLRVLKLRGVRYRGGFHDYSITTGGLCVYPRLVAAEHGLRFAADPVSTGVAELDQLLGGGLVPGTATLFVGPAGVGKTTTAVRCMVAALERGERAALFLFDERMPTLLARCAALGMDLAPFIEGGRLSVRQIDPAELSPGEFATAVRRAVEEDGAGTVLIDSLNAYLQAMPNDKFLTLQMHELLGYLALRGVVGLMVLGQHGITGDLRTDVDLSYLADSTLLLRFFEADGEVRKAISVLKTRTTAHEATIREFRIGSGEVAGKAGGGGIAVGEPLRAFRGILTGVPEYRGADGPLLPTGGAGA